MVIGAEGDPIDIPETIMTGFGPVVSSYWASVESSGNSVDVDPESLLLLSHDRTIKSDASNIAAIVIYEIVLRLIDIVFMII